MQRLHALAQLAQSQFTRKGIPDYPIFKWLQMMELSSRFFENWDADSNGIRPRQELRGLIISIASSSSESTQGVLRWVFLPRLHPLPIGGTSTSGRAQVDPLLVSVCNGFPS